MFNWFAVFLGGGLGSLCRYSISQYIDNSSFPWATLIANGLACFVLGLVIGYSSRLGWPTHWKLLAATGFCGGFSTFSTFSKEALELAQQGVPWSAIGYVLLSLVVGLIALSVGLFLSNNNQL